MALETILDPSIATAVICAVPGATPVMTPDWLTVATAVLLEFQASAGLVALLGRTVADTVVDDPALTEAVKGSVILLTH